MLTILLGGVTGLLSIASAHAVANNSKLQCSISNSWEDVGPCECSGKKLQRKKVLTDICDPKYGWGKPGLKDWFNQSGYEQCWEYLMYMISPEAWDPHYRNDIAWGYRHRGFDPYSRSVCQAQQYLLAWGTTGNWSCPTFEKTLGFPWKWPWPKAQPDCHEPRRYTTCVRDTPCGAASLGIDYSVGYLERVDKEGNFLNNSVATGILLGSGLRKVKVFDYLSTDTFDVLEAINKSNSKDTRSKKAEVMINVPNVYLEYVVKGFTDPVHTVLARKGVVTAIAIGNEPFEGQNFDRFAPLLGLACKKVYGSLKFHGIDRHVKITVPFSADFLGAGSFPPSKAYINQTHLGYMKDCLDIMQTQRSTFLVNIYPYITYLLEESIVKDFAIFRNRLDPSLDGVPKGCFQDNFNVYCNLFEAQYDSFRYALDKAGYQQMPLGIGEAGWPTGGGAAGPFNKTGADVATACKYMNGMLRVVFEDSTPRMRQLKAQGYWNSSDVIDMYLFEAFDESNKDTRGGQIPYEPYWGIWTENGKHQKYPIDWDGTRGFTELCDSLTVPAAAEAESTTFLV
eukprot:TRINITY_DN92857_c0_g1_i1.p1 TRINITY_DN92857_c0_g1~~TRINITY_DN92857_c0_g1_i1.p1  ORF type:complete len:566 (+),score=81.33 TRINITY_DN92857_c0_g1_i1:126-1823(+)